MNKFLLFEKGVLEMRREIVDTAHLLQKMGAEIIWENIGDPIHKGESVAPRIKEIVTELASSDISYGYTASVGELSTREFLAKEVNKRGGCRIGADDILFF